MEPSFRPLLLHGVVGKRGKIMPTISLCVISRKEDDYILEQAVASCLEYVDEVVIVDTGSVQPIVRNLHGESLLSDKVKLTSFKWVNDFSAARNFSFEQATGDYIFWIDSDDTVENPENIRPIVEEMEKEGIQWAMLPYIYAKGTTGLGMADHEKVRIVRNDGKNKWHKPVHENLEREGAYDYEIYDQVKVIHHFDPEKSHEKELRNYAILLAEYDRDGEEMDLRDVHNLAKSSQGLACAKETPEADKKELLEQAIYFYRWHYEKSGWDDERYLSLTNSSICLILLGRFEDAKKAALQAINLRPAWADAYWYLAMVCFETNDFAGAIEWGETAARKIVPRTVLSKNQELYAWSGPSLLAKAYLMRNFIAEAWQVVSRITVDTPEAKELKEIVQEAVQVEDFVQSTIKTLKYTAKFDRKNLSALAYNLPSRVMEDARISQMATEAKNPIHWPERSLVIFCGKTHESWADPSILKGIGGSEAAVIYLSRELVKLGWEVTVYNYCDKLEGEYWGVKYRNYWHFNPKDYFSRLVLWRNPRAAMQAENAKHLYIWNHDAISEESYNAGIVSRSEKIIFLSKWARSLVPSIPEEKVFYTNNGIDPKLFANLPEKKPCTAIYSSSYDRGLELLLENIAPKIYEKLPEFRLHVAYGWDTFLKVHGNNPEKMAWKAKIDTLLEQPFVIHHGRISHKELAKLMGESVAWLYPTEFGETNCITAQEVMCAGCIPITTGVGALPERVDYGAVLDCRDIYTNKKLQGVFIQDVLDAFSGKIVVPDANYKQRFSWEATAKQWNDELLTK